MGRLTVLLDLVGAAFLIAAAALLSPILGLAAAGAACFATAFILEPRPK